MQVNLNSSYNKPAFGMAVKFAPSGLRVMKLQTSKMSEKDYENFYKELDEIIARQEDNLVADELVRGGKYLDRLIVEVVDHGDNPVKISKYSQSLLFPSGLKCLRKGEEKANRLKDLNERLNEYPLATENDYISGKISEELESDGANLDLDV